MSFTAFDSAWWWQLSYILFAGWLATDGWRFLGVYFGAKVNIESPSLVLVRCVATALVAAVIGNLIVFPSGALADSPLLLRIGAAVAGFLCYLLLGKRMIFGILVGEAVLVTGLLIL
ncbi:AzlD domain-containing protein [Limoniibacter endophyticus]|uniref:Branched-subunit amino acid transport protein AzlD n=1 Tax=Limoniibacter endophyticus TaxID=1565040 RepID=A0A8J3GES4_9HYPH|nr:AzlD domain-containing protein [Limoniibacter endophyticus]GHC62170.1 hypothetical protein GCM10010136_03180 [Limoniibacter endophyticus]